MTGKGMTAHRLLAAQLVLVWAAGAARADCPAGQQAACTLHEEGVALFTAGKYDQAATRFRAAIAAAPSARSYLGYAQSVEGQGKIALAYEMMLVAKRMSDEEMAGSGGKNPVLVGRAERIKYKLGELGARVSFAWLRLPEGVPAKRLVSLHRQGEGDLPSPLGRWVTIAPERQVLIAVLDDGRQLEVVAQLAAGSQGHVVIPIPAAGAGGRPARDRPIRDLDRKREPGPGASPRSAGRTSFALDFAMLLPNIGNVAAGFGAAAVVERRLHARLGGTARLGYLMHPATEFDDQALTFSGDEVVALLGVRTRRPRAAYASLEAGVLYYARTASSPAMGPMPALVDEYASLYPALALGGGLRAGRTHLEVGVMIAVPSGELDIPVRFMASLGIDLVSR